MDWSHLRTLGSNSKLVFDGALSLLIVGLLVWKISQGKNWARITYLVLCLFGLPLYLSFVRAAIGRSTALVVLTVLQALMQLAALFLIFVTQTKDWFKASAKVSA
jgi:hypothetical protein